MSPTNANRQTLQKDKKADNFYNKPINWSLFFSRASFQACQPNSSEIESLCDKRLLFPVTQGYTLN